MNTTKINDALKAASAFITIEELAPAQHAFEIGGRNKGRIAVQKLIQEALIELRDHR